MSKSWEMKIIYAPVGYLTECTYGFIPFSRNYVFEHRVVTLSAVGVVLADYNNYILLTGADVLGQQQLNSTGKPK